jgi:hypothetical protein
VRRVWQNVGYQFPAETEKEEHSSRLAGTHKLRSPELRHAAPEIKREYR